jgi:hypothetical protein
MITLEAPYAPALDESAHAFIATFIGHVTTIVGNDRSRMSTIARVNVLLLAALGGGAAVGAWSMLHRAIVEIVPDNNVAGNARRAYDYLQSFIRENGDLAHD